MYIMPAVNVLKEKTAGSTYPTLVIVFPNKQWEVLRSIEYTDQKQEKSLRYSKNFFAFTEIFYFSIHTKNTHTFYLPVFPLFVFNILSSQVWKWNEFTSLLKPSVLLIPDFKKRVLGLYSCHVVKFLFIPIWWPYFVV